MAAWDDTFPWSDRDEDRFFDGIAFYPLWVGPLAQGSADLQGEPDFPLGSASEALPSASEILLGGVDRLIASLEAA